MLFLYSTPYLPFRLILQSLENFIPAEQDWAGGTGPLLPSPSWFDTPPPPPRPPVPLPLLPRRQRGWSFLTLWGRGGHTAHPLLPNCLQEVGKGTPA